MNKEFCPVCKQLVESSCPDRTCPFARVKPKLTWDELKNNKRSRRDIYIILGFAVFFATIISFIYL
jgi:hypothetical protein